MPNALTDVIRLARKIHKENPELLANGLPVQVIPALRVVAENAALARLKSAAIKGGSHHPAEYRVKVFETLVSSEGYLRSLLATFENDRTPHSRVLLTADNNRCWSRFCISKELMHVYTGLVGNPGNVADQISQARKSRFATPSEMTPELDPESFCLYLAIEVLLPWKFRGELSDDIHKRTHLQIATKYLIPRVIIEEVVQTGYLESSFNINKSLAE